MCPDFKKNIKKKLTRRRQEQPKNRKIIFRHTTEYREKHAVPSVPDRVLF